MTESKNTAIDGWQAALEIANWLPGQLRAKAIEQIARQRREYYLDLELESQVGDKSE